MQNIHEIEQLVKGVTLMEHTMQNFNDDLSLFLMEGKLILNEGFWPSWGSIKKGFHTAMDVVQGACALVSLASYSSVVGAPIGLLASVVDAAIDVGYAVGHAANGDWGKAGGRLAWAAVGMIPIAGDTATMSKVAGKTAKTINAVSDVNKAVKAFDAGKDITKMAKTMNLGADVIKGIKAGEITATTLKQIDNIKGLGKTLKGLDAASDVADVFKTGKTITSTADVVMTGNKMTKMAANAISAIGDSKLLKYASLGGTTKLAGYADNFRLANASFATLDGVGAATKVADFATGGAKLFSSQTDLGKRMFDTGIWGGGSAKNAVFKSGWGPTALDATIDATTPSLWRNPIKYTRSMLFNTGDLSKNIGNSSNLIRSTADIAHDASAITKLGDKTKFTLSAFEKIATSKHLNKLGKFSKYAKIPLAGELWQGGITQYDPSKRDVMFNKDRSDDLHQRRTLFTLGPDYDFNPFVKGTTDLTNIGAQVDDDGEKIKGTGYNLSNLPGGVGSDATPMTWTPGHGGDLGPDAFMQSDEADQELKDYLETIKKYEKEQKIKQQTTDSLNQDVSDIKKQMKLQKTKQFQED